MALAATTVWEVRTTGSDNNGGGFKAGATGTDRSQQDAAQVTIDNSSIVCSTPAANSNVLTFVSGYAPTSADVGNVVQIAGGTNVNADFYEITAQTSTTWTLVSRGGQNLTTAGGAGSAITGAMGGALGSPGKAAGAIAAGNKVWVKSGTYSITTATPNVSGGCINTTAKDGSNASMTRWQGYGSARGDWGTPPVLRLSGGVSSVSIWNFNTHTAEHVFNITLDGNGQTSSIGFSNGGPGCVMYKCKTTNCTTGFNFPSTSCSAFLCEAVGCTTGFASNSTNAFYYCYAHGCTNGFSINGAFQVTHGCISANNSGIGFFTNGSAGRILTACTAASNGSHGFDLSSDDRGVTLINCLSCGNGGWGYNSGGVIDGLLLNNCAGGGNTSGNYNAGNLLNVLNFVALTGDPFTNAAGGDFSLNNLGEALGGSPGTDRRGKWLRGAGVPGAFPGGTTTSYPDPGAVQHQDAGGGGSTIIIVEDD